MKKPDLTRAYPKAARKAGLEGSTTLSIDLGPKGVVSGCRIVGSAGHKALDAAACPLARKLRYAVPRDPIVRPVLAGLPLRIRWSPGQVELAAARAPIAAKPKGGYQDWVRMSEYPAAALKAGQAGIVGFSIETTPEGLAAGCAVTRSSGHESLDRATCDLARGRAMFTPASDEFGDAAAGRWDWLFGWRLPGWEKVNAIPPRPIFYPPLERYYPASSLAREEQGQTRLRCILQTGGALTGCVLEESSGFAALDRATFQMSSRVRYSPLIEDGVARETLVIMPVRWILGD